MCTICGCEQPHHAHTHAHAHAHEHGHEHPEAGPSSHTHTHEHGVSTRLLQLEQDILAGNNDMAGHVRQHLAGQHTLALNFVSSPGSGKTTLLVETIQRLKAHAPIAVIEGDQQTSFDAERIRATGVPAVQINTGKGCHLDAHMVHDALHHLPALPGGVLMIENVGNLVCPADFDLGEQAKVLVFSVTEGEDKPLKYPNMFAAASVVLLNKIDLLPHLAFDLDRARQFITQANPDALVLEVSATTGQGFDAWLNWLHQQRTKA